MAVDFVEIPKSIGAVIFDVETMVGRGTPPLELILRLIDNDEQVEEKVFILSEAHIGVVLPFESVFTVKDAGVHNVYTQIETKNPWGTETLETDIDTFEIQRSVIPIDIAADWVLYFADEIDRWQLSSAALERDFVDRGWNIFKKIKCESKSYVAPQWALFKKDYINNPSIVVISNGQTPIYAEGPKFWGPYIYRLNSLEPGYVGYVYKGDEWLNGNNRRIFDIDNFALGKYIMVDGRPVLLDWMGTGFDTGDLRPFVKAWQWMATKGASVLRPWFIFDKYGTIVDWGPEIE